jgi:hypothetical protein
VSGRWLLCRRVDSVGKKLHFSSQTQLSKGYSNDSSFGIISFSSLLNKIEMSVSLTPACLLAFNVVGRQWQCHTIPAKVEGKAIQKL